MKKSILSIVLCLFSGLVFSQAVPKVSTYDADVLNYNYMIGTQTIGPSYGFTTDDKLIETAKLIEAMGSNMIKIDMNTLKYNLPRFTPDSIYKIFRDVPSFKTVLNMNFNKYFFWVTVSVTWNDGLTAAESKREYDQVYGLTRYLLKTYNNSGKDFYFGHWEGDWLLTGTNGSLVTVDPARIQGMIDWLNIRQKAVDDALASVPHTNINIYNYTEVNRVFDAKDKGYDRIANKILPFVNVDYVSYSSYDALSGITTESAMNSKYISALNYIETNLKPKPSISGKRVFIGEYGFPEASNSEAQQNDKSIWVMKSSMAWGCPFVLFWEMYNNEIDTLGNQVGHWLINDRNEKRRLWYTNNSYFNIMKDYVQAFKQNNGRLPSAQESAVKGVAVLTQIQNSYKNITLNVRNNALTGDYSSISKALAVAEINDTIDILGTFTESNAITKSLVLRGHGFDKTIVQGNTSAPTDATLSMMNKNPVFHIGAAMSSTTASNINVTIKDMTIRNGVSSTTNAGAGGIAINRIKGLVNLSGLKIVDNYGAIPSSAYGAGGVYSIGSNVNIDKCWINGNKAATASTCAGVFLATDGNGGNNSKVNINNSCISNNQTTGPNVATIGLGGGIAVLPYPTGGTSGKNIDLRVQNSTIYGNNSTGKGLGIYVKNTILSAAGTGFGSTNSAVKLTVNHCTITNNSSSSTSSQGYGISADLSGTGKMLFSLNNSIVMGNFGNDANQNSAATTLQNQIVGSNSIESAGITNSIFKGTFTSATNDFNNNLTATYNAIAFDAALSSDSIPVLRIGENSIAKDYVQTPNATLLTIDQIGNSRVGNPDAGAYEYHSQTAIHQVDASTIELLENPVNQFLRLKNAENKVISIYNLTGCELNNSVYTTELDVSILTKGIYFVKVKTESNENRTLKFIKK